MGNCKECKDSVSEEKIQIDELFLSPKMKDGPQSKLKKKMSIILEESYQKSSFRESNINKSKNNFEERSFIKNLNLSKKRSEEFFIQIKNKKKIQIKNKGIYEGEIENNFPNGYGKLEYLNGDVYLGYFENGKRSGSGHLLKKNGYNYFGNFSNDLIEGNGVMEFFNGDRYTGFFVNGMFEGHGELFYKNGGFKKGLFKNGKFVF